MGYGYDGAELLQEINTLRRYCEEQKIKLDELMSEDIEQIRARYLKALGDIPDGIACIYEVRELLDDMCLDVLPQQEGEILVLAALKAFDAEHQRMSSPQKAEEVAGQLRELFHDDPNLLFEAVVAGRRIGEIVVTARPGAREDYIKRLPGYIQGISIQIRRS